LIDKVTITQNGKTTTYVNDPTQRRFKDFQATLANLLLLGLTTESSEIMLPFGPPLTTQEAKDPRVLAAAAQAGLLMEPGGPDTYQIVKPTVLARFCFTDERPDLAKLPPSSICGATQSPSAAQADAAPTGDHTLGKGANIPGFENAALSVSIRSTRDV